MFASVQNVSRVFVLALVVLAAACSDDKSTGGVPAAPSMLTVELLEGGGHLTWKDNSDNETQFMIMRMEVGGSADYAVVASPPFDTTAYHDAPLTAGKTYMYMVMAMNDAGESESTNEVMLAVP